jgi:uncharacterized repeat protein (TIGR02543 family)
LSSCAVTYDSTTYYAPDGGARITFSESGIYTYYTDADDLRGRSGRFVRDGALITAAGALRFRVFEGGNILAAEKYKTKAAAGLPVRNGYLTCILPAPDTGEYLLNSDGGYSRREGGLETESGEYTLNSGVLRLNGGTRTVMYIDESGACYYELYLKSVYSYALNGKDVRFTINYTADEGGSIEGDVIHTGLYGDPAGTVRAVPRAGYKFVAWSDGVTTPERSADSLINNSTLRAIFAELARFTLTYTADGRGAIYVDGILPSHSTAAAVLPLLEGEDGAEITAVPDEGWEFLGWYEGDTLISANAVRRDTNVQSDITLTAKFAHREYTLNYTADSGGDITGNTAQTVKHGEDGEEVTAVPNDANGYEFDGWYDGDNRVSADTRYKETAVTGNVTLTARFKLKTYTLTYTAGTGGSIDGNTAQTVTHGEDGTAVTAIPNDANNYVFAGWYDGDELVSDNPQHVAAAVTGNTALTARFALKTYILKYVAGTGGSVNGTAVQTVEHGKNGTAVTAAAGAGYVFCGWYDGDAYVSDTAQRTDTAVTANLTLTAVFANGTAAYPYLLATPAHLSKLSTYNASGKHFKLSRDIALSGTFTPLCGGDSPFAGVLDGNGKTIGGLIVNTNSDYAGLFACVSGTVKNLNVTGASVTGGCYAGILAGAIVSGTLTDITVSGTVTYKNTGAKTSIAFGGLVGGDLGSTSATTGSVIADCHASAVITVFAPSVSANGYLAVGGLIGAVRAYNVGVYTGITGCTAGGGITVSQSAVSFYAGGIVGYALYTVRIVNCSSAANITAQNASNWVCIGGLLGYAYAFESGARISGGSFSGTITIQTSASPTTYIGGLIGCLNASSVCPVFENCDFKGTIAVSGAGSAKIGGVIGQLDFFGDLSPMQNCKWKQNSGAAYGIGGYNNKGSSNDNCTAY